MYLYCSEQALEKDGQGVQVSPNFSVADGLARRFNFWRRIYSLWSENQYVLHVAEYPEVVIAVADGSALWSGLNDVQKQKHISRVLNGEREQFRALLNKMHKQRKDEAAFSPAMKRIAALMAHIKDANKYDKAALSLRIQRGQRDQIARGLTTATRYIHAVEEAFNQEGIPGELSRIAFIESSFNLKARSKVGASGIYQIMPGTGREFMLVNEQIDERHDPIKAAHAAAKILKRNYKMTGAWPLAITSYNHGPYGINKAVRSVGSKDIEKLIARYDGPAFGFASKNFYTGFLALLATVADADQIFPEIPRLQPLTYNEVKMSKATSISNIRTQYKLSNDQIVDYNPDLYKRFVSQNGILPRGYILKIPSQQTQESMITTVGYED
jgi:membrane-bound lytic murein transglycosylase D